MHAQGLILLSGILLAGMGCQWIAWRMKLPAILFLLICGILAGPVLGWLNPDDLFGDLLFPFISLSVAVILFEGGLTLKFREIRGIEAVIRNLITFGMGITWMITALAVHWLLDFPWELAFLFGAIMVVTGPTVIVPMLRSVRPREHLANILRWEGILIDPIGATLAVLVHQFIVTEAAQGELLASITVFGKILAIGFVLGGSAGYFFGTALRRHWVPQYLHNFTTLALVCGIFALSDMLEPESGLLAVTVMGIWMANMKDVHLDEILDFKESLSLVLISMLFIVLAARLDGQAFLGLGWSSLGVFVIIQFISRPVTAHIAALGSKLTMSERHLLAWIAPRGIVAAAISALFAIRLESAGFPEASQMVPLAFLVIIGTVLLQSLTAGPIARWLHVAEPEPKGFLIVGADRLARAIGEALQKNGFRIVLADQAWDNINTANMQGLRTYWGNVASIHADRHLNLSGIGSLLALSPSNDLNALAAKHYRMEFEPKNIYAIRNQEETNQAIQEKAAIQQGGQPLFRETLTRDALCGFLSEGAEVKTTLLTEKFTFEDYLEKRQEHRIPLFAIDPGESIYPLTPKQKIAPEADWKIIGLTLKKPLSDEQAEEFLPEDA
jgi:CPA1 family monovalent cation:H+ antiporter